MAMRTSWRTPRKEVPDFKKKDIPPYPATRFFDQMSFIGDEIVGCFLVETSEGLLLLDCMNPDERSVNIIEDGIESLGLSCLDLKVILISHGHGDHFGRAGYFQRKYGTKICLSKVDFEFASTLPPEAPWKPIDWQADPESCRILTRHFI